MKRVINEYYVEHDGEEFPVGVEPLDNTSQVRVGGDRAVVGYLSSDMDPINPRRNDNVGTMACWHSRYALGDIRPSASFIEHIRELIYFNAKDPDALENEDILRLFNEYFISLPLFLYDHSGITMYTRGFSCPWDSGQVGIIYVSKEKALEEWGPEKTPEQVADYLRSEVEEYDNYLTGDVYGVCFTELKRNSDGEWEEVSSDEVWGYSGSEHANGELEAELKLRAEKWLKPQSEGGE